MVIFSKKGFRVRSFGSGTQVKLPGALPNAPNVYDFGTTYDDMYKDLLTKDKNLYPFEEILTDIMTWEVV